MQGRKKKERRPISATIKSDVFIVRRGTLKSSLTFYDIFPKLTSGKSEGEWARGKGLCAHRRAQGWEALWNICMF